MEEEKLYDKVSNKEKFRTLNNKKKLEYIWDYYKWYMVGAIIAILIIAEVIKIIIAPPPHQYDTHIVVAGIAQVEEEALTKVNDDLLQKFNATLQVMPVNWEQANQGTVAYEQKLMLLASVRELDLYIMSPIKYKNFGNIKDFDPFMALDQIPEFKEILEANKDQLIISKSVETHEEHVYGIKLKSLKGIPEISLGEEFVFTLANPPKNTQKAVEVAKYLLQ